ncbi:MAG TPA: hypothetical protein DCR14_00885 [Acidimicrobiaceae bacterium]|nr:hypothetical protein [Acidimicrobiaceae bacterium]
MSAADRELAGLRAELHAARAAAADAAAAAEAARELNVSLLAALHQRPSPSDEYIHALEARAALADEMAATRLWRWARGPRRIYAAIRRALRIGGR